MNFNFLLLTLIGILFFQCNSASKEKIVGEWKLSKVDIEKAISKFKGEQKKFARSMMKDSFDKVKGKMKMSFKADKTFCLEVPVLDGKIKKDCGTWSFGLNGKKLKLKIHNEVEKHRVIKLTNKELIIEMEQAGFGNMIMSFSH